jgi:hypothetical protein
VRQQLFVPSSRGEALDQSVPHPIALHQRAGGAHACAGALHSAAAGVDANLVRATPTLYQESGSTLDEQARALACSPRTAGCLAARAVGNAGPPDPAGGRPASAKAPFFKKKSAKAPKQADTQWVASWCPCSDSDSRGKVEQEEAVRVALAPPPPCWQTENDKQDSSNGTGVVYQSTQAPTLMVINSNTPMGVTLLM